ncbi:membrane protein [Desulfuromonas versatilis]|uniref:Membrane protein n=1 Tax=Desulfuromonas versatilis TaxID=2802975 RepID=A0ABN6DTL0_9BACT|nr:OmpA family protein [Desulfuromonas versatilis]BCR03463.1 membrane protein [Desulfuromonas versatilis]
MKLPRWISGPLTLVWLGCLLVSAAEAAPSGPGKLSLSLLGGYQLFEGNQGLDDGPVVGAALGYNFTSRWGIEGAVRYVNTETDAQPEVDVRVFSLQLDALYHVLPNQRLIPYLAAGAGLYWTDRDPGASDEDLMVNWGIGLKYFINDGLALRGDIRHILDFNTSDNREDRELFHNLASTAGLSFVFGDADSPTLAVGQWLEKLFPPPAKNIAVADPDPDLDSDGDRIFDVADQCPDTPAGELVDELGCPAGPDEPVYLAIRPVFDPGWVTVAAWEPEEAKQVAGFILAHPERRYTVEVHTDNLGPAEYNLRITQRQADSVRKYLVDNYGIPAESIAAVGYGEVWPVADNGTPQGRERNRRIAILASPEGDKDVEIRRRRDSQSKVQVPLVRPEKVTFSSL